MSGRHTFCIWLKTFPRVSWTRAGRSRQSAWPRWGFAGVCAKAALNWSAHRQLVTILQVMPLLHILRTNGSVMYCPSKGAWRFEPPLRVLKLIIMLWNKNHLGIIFLVWKFWKLQDPCQDCCLCEKKITGFAANLALQHLLSTTCLLSDCSWPYPIPSESSSLPLPTLLAHSGCFRLEQKYHIIAWKSYPTYFGTGIRGTAPSAHGTNGQEICEGSDSREEGTGEGANKQMGGSPPSLYEPPISRVWPSCHCSHVTLQQNTAKLAEIRKKGVFK